MVRQQFLGMAGVLGRDHIDLAKNPQRPQRDILQIPDRRGDNVESGKHS